MRNVGNFDRFVRLAIGVALIAIVFVGPQTPLGWVGLIPLLSALIGFCPLYKMVGLSTCTICKK